VHSPGKIVTDLAVALALGGDCLADVAMLRAQPDLFGPVASDPVVSRLLTRLAADAPRALKAIRSARAAARQRAAVRPTTRESWRWSAAPSALTSIPVRHPVALTWKVHRVPDRTGRQTPLSPQFRSTFSSRPAAPAHIAVNSQG
jgi:hypothetical protein